MIDTLPFDVFPLLEFVIGLNGKKPELVSILNKALENIPAKKIKEIRNRWILESHIVKDLSQKINLTKKEKDFIKKHPKIRVHNEKAWAPFNFYDKGRARGLSIDYIKAITKKVGIEIEFISGPSWNKFINMSKNKEIDVMLNIVQSPARDKFLNFTEPYSELMQSLYIKKGATPITKTEELFGKTFVVPKGFYYEDELKKYPQIKVLRVKDTLECIQAISFGKADAMLDLTTVINYYKNKHHISDVVLGGTLGWEGGTLPIKIGIRDDWPELVSILNKALAQLSEEEISNLENKWLFNISTDNKNLINLTKEEKKWISSNSVTVGVEEWAPVIFSQGGNAADGITGDILKLIAVRTGLKFEIINDLWDPLLKQFKEKKIDLLPATYYTDERAKYGLFSEPYYKMLDYLYIKEDNKNIKSMEDLNGKKVAIPKGFGTIPKVRKKFPNITIIETVDMADSVQKVLSGQVDALFDGQIAVEYHLQENLIRGLKGIPQKSFKAASLYFFSHIKKPILRDILNKALKSIPTYEVNQIKAKWLLETEKKKQQFDLIQEKKDIKLIDILPVKEILIGLLLFTIIFYFIWKYQIKSTKKDFALKGTLFVIIGVFLFLASVITILTINNLEKAQKQEIKESLKTILNSSYQSVKLWSEGKYRKLDIVLENDKLSNLILDSNNKESLEALNKHLKNYEKVFEDSRYYLLSEDMKILSKNIDKNIDKKLLDEISNIVHNNKITNRYIHIPHKEKNHKQENLLFIKVVKHNLYENVGYLIMEVNPQIEFTKILQSGRIGNSGETYAFNEQLQMISNSRFDQELRDLKLLKNNETSFLNIQIKKIDETPTYVAKKSMDKISGINIDGYKDYRGIDVYGAWIWDDDLNIAFVTEIDELEAMGAFNTMKKTIMIIVFSIVLFTIFLTLLVAWISNKSKKSLEKANKDLSKLLNSFDENVITSRSDLKGTITYVSKAFVEISGYTIDELMGKPHSTIRHPDTPKETFKDMWKTIQSGKVWKGELKNLKKNSGFYWIEAVITPEFDEKGNITGYSAIRQDITAKKEVEGLSNSLEQKVEERTFELNEAQKQFSSMASNVPGAIYRVIDDSAWPIIYMSDDIINITGYPAKDFMESKIVTFSTIMHPDDVEPIGKIIQEQFSKGKNFQVDYRVITKNGNIKWIRSQGQHTAGDIEEGYIDGVLIDITEQKELETLIKENTEQMTYVSQHANLGFWNFNPQTGDLFVNDVFVQMLDYNSNDVLLSGYENEMFKPFKDGLAFREQLIHPDDVEKTNEIITAHINGKTDLYKAEYRMKRANGSWMWSRAIGRISEFDKDGKPIKFNGVNIDIDDAKKAQKEIDEQKSYIDSIMNSQENIVISTDGVELRTANKAFIDFFDISNIEEFTSKYGDCICDTFDIDKSDEFVQKMMGKEKWIDYVYSNNKTLNKAKITRNNKAHIFSITADKFTFRDEELMVAVFTDITELEKQKKQTEDILASILLPTIITDKKNRTIVYANEFANEQYEAVDKQLVGGSIDTLYASEHQKDDILDIINKNGLVKNYETKFKTLKDNQFDALLSLVDIEFNGQDCYLGVASDITKQKDIEAEIRNIHKHTKDSIEYAALIQGALIPDNNIFNKYFRDYFTIWEPKDIVGGDIYLFEELRNKDECLVMVIDCTGHGVPGAFVTMLVKAIERQVIAKINNDINIDVSPAWILAYFNKTMKKLLKQESKESLSNAGFDGGVIYFNKKENILKFAGAETPLFYFDENGEFKTIKGSRHSIGYKKSDVNFVFKDHIIDIKDEMQFYLTTDGYLDQNGGEKSFPFGKKQFSRIIKENYGEPLENQKQILIKELHNYQRDEERNDDITLVGFTI